MVALLLILASSISFAEDRLGVLKVESTRVQFEGTQVEKAMGGFSLSESWIRFRWSLNDEKNLLSSIFEIGTPDLVKPSVFISPPNESSLTLSQGWIKYEGRFADVRVGLMPVPFGSRGLLGVEKINFPKTLWQEQNWLATNDLGLEFNSHYKEFETRLMIHNGEGASTNKDGRLWTTAAWTYSPNDEISYTVSGSVGNTKSESTNQSQSSTLGFLFDKDSSAKIRLLDIFVSKFWAHRSWILEYGIGDTQQTEALDSTSEKKKFGYSMAQVSWPISLSAQFLGRVSQIQSDFKEVNTLTRGYGAGFEFRDEKEVLSLTLFGEKREEKNSVQNDLLTVQFRLNTLR